MVYKKEGINVSVEDKTKTVFQKVLDIKPEEINQDDKLKKMCLVIGFL